KKSMNTSATRTIGIRNIWGTSNVLRRAVGLLALCASVVTAAAGQGTYPKPTELPNPYRLVEHWPTLPPDMNGGRWGEVIRVDVDAKGSVWVFHRCFNVVPAGSATCVGRGPENPPILEFSPAGQLLRSFGAGLFAYPHGFTVDQEGNLWATDVNDAEVVLGMSARNAAGVVMGQKVLKLSPNGQVLMTLGKEGVSGNSPETFDRPTGVAIAPNGDIFVTDGHLPNAHNNGRVLKFSKDGRFIKTWGKKGSAPGDFDEPHSIALDTQGRVFVADRGKNERIEIFDADGNFIAEWKHLGRASGVYVDANDNLYVGDTVPQGKRVAGKKDGIWIA